MNGKTVKEGCFGWMMFDEEEVIMENRKTEDVTTQELVGILRRHKGGNAAFNALMDSCADQIAEFMEWEKEEM